MESRSQAGIILPTTLLRSRVAGAFVYAPAIPRATLSSSYSLWLHWCSSAARGVAAQVQKHLGSLAEALAGKGARAACDARAAGEELSARRFARTAAKADV